MSRGPKPLYPPCEVCHRPRRKNEGFVRCGCGSFAIQGGELVPAGKRGRPKGAGVKLKRARVAMTEETMDASGYEQMEGWLGWEA